MSKRNIVVLAAATLMATSFGAMQTAHAADGEKVFRKCMACHTLEAGKHRVGPSLAGVVGRKAGTAEGYNRYKGMKGADWTWTPELIKEYLADPTAFTKARTGGRSAMVFKLTKEDEREAVVKYLEAH